MKQRQLIKQLKYLTAKDPEQRVAHIPPIVAPGPECQHNAKKMLISIAKMDQQIVAKTATNISNDQDHASCKTVYTQSK